MMHFLKLNEMEMEINKEIHLVSRLVFFPSHSMLTNFFFCSVSSSSAFLIHFICIRHYYLSISKKNCSTTKWCIVNVFGFLGFSQAMSYMSLCVCECWVRVLLQNKNNQRYVITVKWKKEYAKEGGKVGKK